jgi:hypothetical protein
MQEYLINKSSECCGRQTAAYSKQTTQLCQCGEIVNGQR